MKEHSGKASDASIAKEENSFFTIIRTIQRAFKEFLALPTSIIVCFLLLVILSYSLDSGHITWVHPFRSFMKAHIFADAKATSSLLGAIAGGIITVSSLTITLLLLVVQQTASAMTTQVFDQFLRGRQNQIYFGFFIGLALYALIVLSMVSNDFNPVIGASLVLLLTVVALYLLVVLIYTTIYEMRPAVIIEAIHDHVLKARKKQLKFIAKTRRVSLYNGTVHFPVYTLQHGYVTGIDLDKIQAAIKKCPFEVEVVFQVSIGHFIAYKDQIAFIKAAGPEALDRLAHTVYQSVRIEYQRDIDMDPNDGINQLEMIAWTSISTSKSNPQPGLLTIRILRNLLSRWYSEHPKQSGEVYPIVYTDDVMDRLMDTFETLAIVASESMQHQNFIEVIRTFRIVFERLPEKQKQRVEDITLRILSVMGDFALTAPLEATSKELVAMLSSAGRFHAAQAVEEACKKLHLSVGNLNSRATRVPQ